MSDKLKRGRKLLKMVSTEVYQYKTMSSSLLWWYVGISHIESGLAIWAGLLILNVPNTKTIEK